MVMDLFPTRLSRAASALAVSLVLLGFPQVSYAADQTVVFQFEEGGGADWSTTPKRGEDAAAGHISHAIYRTSPFGALDIRISSLQSAGPKSVTIRCDTVEYSGHGDLVTVTSSMNVKHFALVASLDSVPAGAALPRWDHISNSNYGIYMEGQASRLSYCMLHSLSFDDRRDACRSIASS